MVCLLLTGQRCAAADTIDDARCLTSETAVCQAALVLGHEQRVTMGKRRDTRMTAASTAASLASVCVLESSSSILVTATQREAWIMMELLLWCLAVGAQHALDQE